MFGIEGLVLRIRHLGDGEEEGLRDPDGMRRALVEVPALVLAHAVLALTGSLIDAGWLPQGGLSVLEATAALEGKAPPSSSTRP